MNVRALAEAVATARSQPVASIVTIVMIAGMIVALMLTTGRTAGAEQEVLASVDSAGTRSITVSADAGAGVTSDVLLRIAHIEGIEWAGAFSSAVDATNSSIPEGMRVPVRLMYGGPPAAFGIPVSRSESQAVAFASDVAIAQLGMPDGFGSVTLTSGQSFAVAGTLTTPDFLRALEPLVIVPQPKMTGGELVSKLVVIAESPELVAPVSSMVLSVLAPEDPTKVAVQTSEALAQLRSLIESQLGSFSRGLVLVLLAITGVLVFSLLYGLVMMRRKDFGRRRALGATKTFILQLVLLQTAILAAVGVAVGSFVSTVILVAADDPLPGIAFFAAITVLTILTTLIAALVPALVASRREPIRELRVP